MALIFGIIYYYFKEERKKKNWLVDIAFVLIIAGAVGNGVERIFFDSVTDFIAVQYFSIFNFADGYVTIGGLIYVCQLLKKGK